ncbi:MAG: hypothetical protein QXV73_04395 [Candidatus Micrarchaeia archaeon]
MTEKEFAIEKISEIVAKKIWPSDFFNDFVKAKETNNEELMWELFTFFNNRLETFEKDEDELIFFVFLYKTGDFGEVSKIRNQINRDGFIGGVYKEFTLTLFDIFTNKTYEIFKKVIENIKKDGVPYENFISKETKQEYEEAIKRFESFLIDKICKRGEK